MEEKKKRAGMVQCDAMKKTENVQEKLIVWRVNEWMI